jgi:hypothetical protein
MAPGERVDVQNRQGKPVFGDSIRFGFSRDDLAENAGRGFASLLGFAFLFPLHRSPSLS